MDDELKTFGVGEPEGNTNISPENTLSEENTDLSSADPLLKEQKLQVDQMRSTLLSFNKADPNSAKRAMQNITVLRIYHQVTRIIKFTEMMDLLEDKLYTSMIENMTEMDTSDPMTMMSLLKVQEQLQNTMIQSQLLIKPYLDMDIESIAPPPELEETSFGAAIISQESRNNIRTGAQALLTELKKANPNLPQEEPEEEVDSEESDDRSADSR
jgi:hypothetical protein